MVPLDFLKKISSLNDYDKSDALSVHYQLSILQSRRFPSKTNWTGACVLCSARPQNRIHRVHAASFSIALHLNAYLNALHLSAYLHFIWVSNFKNTGLTRKIQLVPSNSSCLEIDHFEKTATAGINLGQHFYRNC